MSTLAGDLATLQRMPTVSAAATAGPALRGAAAWLAGQLDALGARRIPLPANGSAPFVAAERPGAPGAPMVLIYGHYDVVAAGPPGSWRVPPYAAIRRGRTLWGRGASDDKGPVVAGLHAVRRLSAAGRRVCLKFLYEGEEEIGSPHLAGTLAALRGWLRDVDAVLICDTESDVDGRPTLTHALRGQLSADLTATGSGRALHAGRYGGAVPNPAQALAMLVASLHHPDGRVAVAGFHDAVHAAPFTARPAVVVDALCAGECRPGPWHVIPATATAKLNLRLVPGQHPARVERLLRAHLAARRPTGIRLRLDVLTRVEPWQLNDFSHPAVRAAVAAVRRTWGAPPTLTRSGGTIPAVSLLSAVIPRAALLLLGFARHGENAHARDEHVDLDRLNRAANTLADLIDTLGRTP